MTKTIAALALAFLGCTTAHICRNGSPTYTPLLYHLPGDSPSDEGHHFSPSAVSSHHGNADDVNCGLPNATVDDPELGIHCVGTIYLEGTGDWSNGLTGYEIPVFVGECMILDMATGNYNPVSQVAVLFKEYVSG